MNDTIYRQDAIEGLYDVFFDDELSAAYPKEADKVLDVIRKLPSASCQQVTGKLDLVDRRNAIDALEVWVEKNKGASLAGCLFHWRKFEKFLDDLPSAQPEIIYCKDCKHSAHWYRDRRRCFLWSEDGVSVFDDGFCSYAERRTDE